MLGCGFIFFFFFPSSPVVTRWQREEDIEIEVGRMEEEGHRESTRTVEGLFMAITNTHMGIDLASQTHDVAPARDAWRSSLIAVTLVSL